ncbi:MAG: ABC transporter ATP-binding protein [Deltaproteobacteria bacterium]|jgi:ATP-binding cassette, subfamily C, bacterial|nr:ABC transporter ATP-binding protein [Deltaproteobacteria bacterium]MBT4640768.1 ABC transporter ATP-binding protein [Deltaproteobacteria bacterium]
MTESIPKAIYLYLKSFLDFCGIRAGVALGLIIFKGFTQGIGILMLIPLLHISGFINTGNYKGKSSQFFSELIDGIGISFTLMHVLLIYVLLVGIYSFFNYYQTILNNKINQEYTQFLRIRLYKAIAYTEWPFFSQCKKSDFTHALTSEIQRISSGTHFFLNLMGSGVIVLIYIVLAFIMSPVLATLTFVSATLLLLMLRPLNKKALNLGSNLRLNSERMYQSLSEHLNGMKETKCYSAEEQQIGRFTRFSQKSLDELLRFNITRSKSLMINEVGAVLFISLLFYLAAEIVHVPILSVLVLVYLFSRILPRISNLHQFYQQLINMLPSFIHINNLQKKCMKSQEVRSDSQSEIFKLKSGIRFEEVNFQYNSHESSQFQICNLNCKIPNSKITAIIGPSGAGKSTMADLLMGLIYPGNGAIFIDQVELTKENVGHWRQLIGYVPQDTFLFNDTIRANLEMVNPKATEKEIWDVLKNAAADDFVKNLVNGLDTIVGERGQSLSGGERQRLALARALLRRPQVIILDEATNSLDESSELKIQSAIQQIRGQCTILVIAHRLSTIKTADQILVLENGKITESGKWEDLQSIQQNKCTFEN